MRILVMLFFLSARIFAQEKGTIVVSRPDSVYTTVDEKAMFPNGQVGQDYFIKRNLKFPKAEMENGVSGISLISFVVEKDGSLKDIMITPGSEGLKAFDSESLRVVKMMPKWIPAKIGGKPVRSAVTMRINFALK